MAPKLFRIQFWCTFQDIFVEPSKIVVFQSSVYFYVQQRIDFVEKSFFFALSQHNF